MEKLKLFISWPIEIGRTIYTKLVDKIFGKRCQCINKIKHTVDREKFVCQNCGKIHA
jgi:hypothetical protein